MSDLGRVIAMILYVSDLERSVQFYRDLLEVPLEPGSNEPEDDPWIGGQHAEISWRDGAYLHFALFPARPPHRITSGVEIGLMVADAAKLHELIDALERFSKTCDSSVDVLALFVGEVVCRPAARTRSHAASAAPPC